MVKQNYIFYGVAAFLALLAIGFAVFANMHGDSHMAQAQNNEAAAHNPPSKKSAAAGVTPGACREYHKEVMIEGQKVNAYGKSCQREDGTWAVVKD